MNAAPLPDRVSRDRAELEAALLIARAHPRDEPACEAEILRACEIPAVAAAAVYRVRRDNDSVVDASIGLAREIRRLWGHLRSGVRVHPGAGDDIHVEGWAHDLQRNTLVSYEHRVPRKVLRFLDGASKGTWVDTTDEDALRELAQSVASRLERNAILRIVPEALVTAAVRRCIRTMDRVADGDVAASPSDVVRAILGRFGRFGVTREDLERKVGERLERAAGNPKALAVLRETLAAIESGSTTAAAAFPPPADLEGAEAASPDLEPGAVPGDVVLGSTDEAAAGVPDPSPAATLEDPAPDVDPRIFKTSSAPREPLDGDQWERPDGIVLRFAGKRWTETAPPPNPTVGELHGFVRGWCVWDGRAWSGANTVVRQARGVSASNARALLEELLQEPVGKAPAVNVAAAAARILLESRAAPAVADTLAPMDNPGPRDAGSGPAI